MDNISRADKPARKLECPDQGLKNYGARQFEHAFVKRPPLSPQMAATGKSATEFVQCVWQNSYCVGSTSCVGCVPQLRTASSSPELRTPQLRPASSSVASVLRPVACQLRLCASPNSVLSRMFRNSRRAATAMKVQRTAERLAHIVSLHQRALVELSKFSVRRSGPVGQSVSSPVGCRASSELRPSLSRSCELREASPSTASSSNLRPCELRPVALPSASSESCPELVERADCVQRESPLRKFASVASQSASVKSASVQSASVSVALLRPPKRSLH
jgi:hypothetical protein